MCRISLIFAGAEFGFLHYLRKTTGNVGFRSAWNRAMNPDQNEGIEAK
jgi:hypothetical protein